MPTYDFHEKLDQRSSERVQGQKVFERKYQLEVSTRITEAEADAYVASVGAGLPGLVIGSAHPDFAGSGTILRSVKCEDEAADGRSWLVTAQWATPQAGSLDSDPLDRPAEFDWNSEQGTEDIFKDYSATPLEVVNTAGLPFDTLPQRDCVAVQVQMVRNETVSFFRSTALPLMGYYGLAVNLFQFTIDGVVVPALKGRVIIRSAQRITEGATTYYRVTYIVQIRNGCSGYEADGWRERFLSRGHYCLGDGVTSFVDGPHPCRDADGQIIEEAAPLDEDGHFLGDTTLTPAVVGPFKFYKEIDFAPLGFA